MVPSLKKGVLILKKGSHPVKYEDCESDGPQVIKRKLFYVLFHDDLWPCIPAENRGHLLIMSNYPVVFEGPGCSNSCYW